MKVLTPGREQKGWAREFTCTGRGNGTGGCGAVLLVEKGDLFLTGSSAPNYAVQYITFRCCACGVLTDVACNQPVGAPYDAEVPNSFFGDLRTE